jgi:serine/threonine protein kinase
MEPKEPQQNFEAIGDFEPSGQNETRLTSGQNQPSTGAKPYISDDKLKPGDIIGDNYVIIELLGIGGMGYVYKVRHLILEKIYAMKTISGEQISEIAWRRLQVEAQAIARINHPNIVGIHNLGIHQGKIPYYVMDYLKGNNLAQILKKKRHLSLEQSLPLFIEICKGLGFAHKKGIVHRDIKPGNIVILDEPDFNGARVKIVDFGIAKLAGTIDPDNQKLTTIGEVFGSPLYMSPEQCDGKRIDARSDIYSLGCTFFEVLSGDVPFHGENPVATMLMHNQAEPPTLYEASGLDFPESMEVLVANMLAKAPMDRYPNLESVAEDLQNILEGREINAAPFNAHGMPNRLLDDQDKNQSNLAPETEALKAIESITPRKIAILAGTLLVSLMVIIVYFFNQRAIDKTTAVATKAIVANTTPAKTEKYSHLLSNGQIQFNFPEDHSIGTISTVYNDPQAKQAQSIITFKKNEKLYFAANEDAITHPECFDLFKENDLYSFSAPQSSIITDIEKTSKECDVNSAIPHIAKLSGLEVLNLDMSNTSDSAVEYLSRLPNLKTLKLCDTRISHTELSRLKQLKNLTYLSFSHNNGCIDLLRALAGSTKIDSLYLEGQTIDEECAHLLASCPNLKHLDLEGSTTTNKLLAIIATLPKLEYVGVTACPVTKAGIAKARKAHSGSNLKVASSKNVKTNLDEAFGGEDPANWLLEK